MLAPKVAENKGFFCVTEAKAKLGSQLAVADHEAGNLLKVGEIARIIVEGCANRSRKTRKLCSLNGRDLLKTTNSEKREEEKKGFGFGH